MLKKLISYFVPAAFTLMLLVGGCAKQKGDIVGKAGKMVITADEFKETMLKRYRSEEFAQRRPLKDRVDLAEQIAENKLRLQDAYSKGLDKDSLVLAKAEEARKQAAIQELYKVEILDKVIPPEAIRAEYDKTAEEIHAKHILFKTYMDMEPQEVESVKKRAEKYYTMLKNGADFDSLAKNVSEDVTTAKQGGDLGYFTWGKMVDEFQNAAFALKSGEMSDVVKSSYGFHIIKLIDRRPNENRPPFKDEEEKIRMNLRQKYTDELNKAAQDYLDSLKEEAGLKYDYNRIQKILDKVSDPDVPRNNSYFANFSAEEKQWPVAWMGKDTIRVSDMEAEISKSGRAPQWRDQKAIIQMVDRMMLPDLLANKAEKLGLYKAESVKEAYKSTLEMEMMRRIENIEVTDKVDLSDKVLHDYYDNHNSEFMTDSTVEVQEIYVLIDEKKGNDRDLAQKLANQARSGADFTKLVKKYSDRKSALGRDGKIGPITSRQYGAMGKAAFTLEIGEISDPIKMGRRGWSVIKLLDKSPARLKTFDECKSQVERAARNAQTEELKTAWMDGLKERYPVTIYDEKLMTVLPVPEGEHADTTAHPQMKTIPITKGNNE